MSNHDPTAGGPICLRPIGSAELRVEGLSGHFWRKFISTVFSVTFPAMKAVGELSFDCSGGLAACIKLAQFGGDNVTHSRAIVRNCEMEY